MKTVRLLLGMMLIFFMAFAPMDAEAHKGHKGKHKHRVHNPYWVPAHIIKANVRHVYFPDYNVYYDRWNDTFIYLEGRRWVVSGRVPVCLNRINFTRAYKVGLYIDSPRPYVYNRRHLADYRVGRSYHYDQGYYKRGHHHSKKGRNDSRVDKRRGRFDDHHGRREYDQNYSKRRKDAENNKGRNRGRGRS